jgi:hypothetical protein
LLDTNAADESREEPQDQAKKTNEFVVLKILSTKDKLNQTTIPAFRQVCRLWN